MARDGDERRNPTARGVTQILMWVAYFDKGMDLDYELLPSPLT